MVTKNLGDAEAAAWQRIAVKVDKRGLGASGLCHEVNDVVHSVELRHRMTERLRRHLRGRTWFEGNRGPVGVFGPHAPTTERAQLRVTMALFLSNEAKSEARAA